MSLLLGAATPVPLATVVESSPVLEPLVFGLGACGILFALGLRGLATDRGWVRGLALVTAGLVLGFLQLNVESTERTPELGWVFFAGLLNLALGLRVLATTHRSHPARADALVILVRHPGYTGAACLLGTGGFLTIASVLEAL